MPTQTPAPSEAGNEDKWRTDVEDYLRFLTDRVNVSDLRYKVQNEIKRDPKGLEYVEKVLDDDKVLVNLNRKLSQKENKGLRGELSDINNNFIEFSKRFTGIKTEPVETKQLKEGKTPATTQAPAGAATLPSHGTGSDKANAIKKFTPAPDFDVEKATREFEKNNPLSSFKPENTQ